MRDAVRLAVGTLTILPVRPPDRVDRRTAGRAMVLAPLVGLLLGVVVVAVLAVLGARTGGAACRPSTVALGTSPLLAAVLAVALVAVLTRALHLDGLADTVDGLGSRAPQEQALAIMRSGDVGPFGVAALVLVLLLQVAALASLFARGAGLAALVTALLVSRLALPLMCSRGVPAARAAGLGSTVTGTVSRVGLLAAAVPVLVVVALVAPVASGASCGAGTASLLVGDASVAAVIAALAAVLAPLLVAGALCLCCVRRLGGITGDVLGGCVELGFTTCLVALALL